MEKREREQAEEDGERLCSGGANGNTTVVGVSVAERESRLIDLMIERMVLF